ncbi:Unknown protein sequence [Pseudomonas syringae pv. maculicola]|nr:Unknown protein sequence [Pseudomonas syringae pv. maculicola]
MAPVLDPDDGTERIKDDRLDMAHTAYSLQTIERHKISTFEKASLLLCRSYFSARQT